MIELIVSIVISIISSFAIGWWLGRKSRREFQEDLTASNAELLSAFQEKQDEIIQQMARLQPYGSVEPIMGEDGHVTAIRGKNAEGKDVTIEVPRFTVTLTGNQPAPTGELTWRRTSRPDGAP